MSFEPIQHCYLLWTHQDSIAVHLAAILGHYSGNTAAIPRLGGACVGSVVAREIGAERAGEEIWKGCREAARELLWMV